MEITLWLGGQGLSVNQIDKFLKLEYVRVQIRCSCYQCKLMIFDRFDSVLCHLLLLHNLLTGFKVLPKPPLWKCREITVEGGTTRTPIKFFFRDGLECFCFLFGNPVFFENLEIEPYMIFEDDFQENQVFSEPNSGKYTWKVQVRGISSNVLRSQKGSHDSS